MDLASGDQIHRDLVLVEDSEDASQKGMGYRSLVRVYVDDSDLIFDRDSCRSLWLLPLHGI